MKNNDQNLIEQEQEREYQKILDKVKSRPTIINVIITIGLFIAVNYFFSPFYYYVVVITYVTNSQILKYIVPVLIGVCLYLSSMLVGLIEDKFVFKPLYKCLCVIFVLILFIFLNFGQMIFEKRDDYKQTEIVNNTIEFNEIIKNQTEFYKVVDNEVIVSLYYLENSVYLNYQENDTQEIHELEVVLKKKISDEGSHLIYDESKLDIVFALEYENSNILIYTDRYYSVGILKFEGDSNYYCFDSVLFIPSISKHAQKVVLAQLREDISCGPFDYNGVYYANYPNILLEEMPNQPIGTYNIKSNITPIQVKEDLGYMAKSADESGENNLTRSLDYYYGNISAEAHLEMAFEVKKQSDVIYYYFIAHDIDRYVRCSNVMEITLEQYESLN